MSHPFLANDFHIRWSTLTPDAIEPDITKALEDAQTAVDSVAALSDTATELTYENTIAALELLAGFEQSLSSRGIPVQEQYSLGGQKSIRGISVNQALGENLALVRLELRQDLYPTVDWNFADFLAYRRPQIRLFLDSGNVDDSVRRTFDPGQWAIGGGIGISVLYDFMGFFPGSAYLEIATRLDRDQEDVQVLFGTRQAF